MEEESNSAHAIGRHMMLVAWIIVLALLAYFFSGILEKQHNPNRRVQSSVNSDGAYEVTLKRNRHGHYVTSGYINNQPVVFLLDTGATVVSIPAPVARRLALVKGAPNRVSTANGMIITYATGLDSVGIGNIKLHNIAAHINPHMGGEEILLGMSFLKKLELLQQGNTLMLRQPS